MADVQAPTTVTLRSPSKYASAATSTPGAPAIDPSSAAPPFQSPPISWLTGTWSVTHSTLSMWRSAKNVRITYKPLASADSSSNATPPIDDMVEYEKKSKAKGGVKSVHGVDKPDPTHPGAWNWRGKGLLAIASSHWEVLGWGERPLAGAEGGVERWAVTWFAPTLFTKEGVDIYSDRREGLSEETVSAINKALKGLEAKTVADLVAKDMQPVEVSLPWQEK